MHTSKLTPEQKMHASEKNLVSKIRSLCRTLLLEISTNV